MTLEEAKKALASKDAEIASLQGSLTEATDKLASSVVIIEKLSENIDKDGDNDDKEKMIEDFNTIIANSNEKLNEYKTQIDSLTNQLAESTDNGKAVLSEELEKLKTDYQASLQLIEQFEEKAKSANERATKAEQLLKETVSTIAKEKLEEHKKFALSKAGNPDRIKPFLDKCKTIEEVDNTISELASLTEGYGVVNKGGGTNNTISNNSQSKDHSVSLAESIESKLTGKPSMVG